MEIKTATFIKSSTQNDQCPPPNLPEFAFIGRSNVGKSSLINAMVKRRDLAKTSQNPGKTQTINHFLINNNWYLVDLPGYGYAKVSKTEREKWVKMIDNYLTKRENLVCTFVLIDIRIEPQKNDLEFMAKLGMAGVPFVIVFTKTDKFSQTKIDTALEKYNQKLLESWEELPQQFITSARERLGCDDILIQIDEFMTLDFGR